MKLGKKVIKMIEKDNYEDFQNEVDTNDDLDIDDFKQINDFLVNKIEKGKDSYEKYLVYINDIINDLEKTNDEVNFDSVELNNLDSVSLHMQSIRNYDLLDANAEVYLSTEYQKFKALLKKINQLKDLVEEVESFTFNFLKDNNRYPIKEEDYNTLNLYEDPLLIDKDLLKEHTNIKNDYNFYIYQHEIHWDLPPEYVINTLQDFALNNTIPTIKNTNEVNFSTLVKKKIFKTKPLQSYLYEDNHFILLDEDYFQERVDYFKEQLVNSNLRLVFSIAKKMVGNGLEIEDLIQEGTFGLMKAVDKYNPKLGYRFSTYATWWIKQSIRRGIADHGRTIRLPVHRHEQIGKIDKISRRLAEELNREPTLDELSEVVEKELSINRKKLANLLNNLHRTKSLDQTISDDNNNSIKDYISDDENQSPEKMTMNVELKDKLLYLFNLVLDTREQTILILRNGIHNSESEEKIYTLQDIGQILNLTRERVRQIEIKALKKLRHPACQKYLSGYHGLKMNKDIE